MKTLKTGLVAGAIALSLIGCGSSKKEPVVDEQTTLPTTGIWQAPAYGWIFDIKDKEHTIYQVTEHSCQIFYLSDNYDYTHQDFLNSTVVSADKHTFATTIIGLKVPGVVASKIDKLPENCTNNLEKSFRDEGYQFNAQRELDIFWETFDELYAFFDIEDIDWQAVYQFADEHISADSSQEELHQVLAQMITPLKDFHVNLFDTANDKEFSVSRKEDKSDILLNRFKASLGILGALNDTQHAMFEEFYDHMHQYSYDVIFSHLDNESLMGSNETETILWGKTPDNLGYLFLETMELEDIGDNDKSKQHNLDELAKTLDSALDDLANIDGLVIDVRYNDGGDDFVGQYIIGRLIDAPLHVYSKQARLGNTRTALQEVHVEPSEKSKYLGPIVLLTSQGTSSAAETFAISVRARDNTTLIGESSAGGLSDMLPKTLPYGLTYTLSNEFYLTPDGELFEGTGIPVDLERPFFDDALFNDGIDRALEAALEHLQDQY